MNVIHRQWKVVDLDKHQLTSGWHPWCVKQKRHPTECLFQVSEKGVTLL